MKYGILKPGEKKEFSIILSVFDNQEKNTPKEVFEKVEILKRIDAHKEMRNCKQYWKKYLKSHLVHEINDETSYQKKLNQIYKRTILLYPLLVNSQTGGVSAAMEIDETFSKCGRYAYCWPRDAIYITKAWDLLKMEKDTEKFYKVFCKKTQSKTGMWEQRFFTDGTLAPCWGYQIDETASVIYRCL